MPILSIVLFEIIFEILFIIIYDSYICTWVIDLNDHDMHTITGR